MAEQNLISRFSLLLISSLCLLVLFPAAVLPVASSGLSFPLSAKSRWIVDGTGRRRVKLACVNWAAHLQPVVPEGLSRQPVDAISRQITAMGFNCVRLTWPLFLATNHSLASLTVHRSFAGLGLRGAIAGVRSNNPSFLGLSLIDAFKAVVSSLGRHGLMVILDNHKSQPGWCCTRTDGDGFFGDADFDPGSWVAGLTAMAALFRPTPYVVAMSLRNELRGPKQNVPDWYRYMEAAAAAVHAANPGLIVILSGLSFDTDLSFLRTRPVALEFREKIAYEIHWYANSDGGAWDVSGRRNRKGACRSVKSSLSRRGWFLLKRGFPVFVGEFGGDLGGPASEKERRYLGCFFSVARRLDLDWAYWTLAGSYYLRNGVVGMEERYGLLTADWSRPRNPDFLQRLAGIQTPKTTRVA